MHLSKCYSSLCFRFSSQKQPQISQFSARTFRNPKLRALQTKTFSNPAERENQKLPDALPILQSWRSREKNFSADETIERSCRNLSIHNMQTPEKLQLAAPRSLTLREKAKSERNTKTK